MLWVGVLVGSCTNKWVNECCGWMGCVCSVYVYHCLPIVLHIQPQYISVVSLIMHSNTLC